jgi:hypothetical protein
MKTEHNESLWAGVSSSPLAGPTPVFGGGSESGGDKMAIAVYKALVTADKCVVATAELSRTCWQRMRAILTHVDDSGKGK